MIGKIKFFALGLMALGLGTVTAFEASAQDGGADLATKATNPVGSANQLQFQNLYRPDNNNSSGDANNFIIQPILSFNLPEGGYFQTVVTRITLPYVWTPDLGPNKINDDAFGDTVAIVAPTHTTPGTTPGEFRTWAPVLAGAIPTSGSQLTGGDDWKAGPGFLYLENTKFAKNSLMWGVLGWHLWDVNGDVDSSVTSINPLFVYKFDSLFNQKGWYVRLPDDVWNYDWKANEFTVIPVGASLGRAFVWGKQPVNMFLGGWWNAASPDTAATADWAIKASFSLVFPK